VLYLRERRNKAVLLGQNRWFLTNSVAVYYVCVKTRQYLGV
jgi:hypothetical protein